jgi:hypothetical protein
MYAICLVEEKGEGKVMICINGTPYKGDEIEATKGNLYWGGFPDVPRINQGEMLGKKWKVLKDITGKRDRFVTLSVREVK